MSRGRQALLQSLSAVALIMSAAAPTAFAQSVQETAADGTISGVVTDAEGFTNIAGAAVRLEPTGQRVSTSSDGRFRFSNLAPGEYTIIVSYLGAGERRAQVTIAAGRGAELNVALATSAPTEADAIVVTGTRGSLASARAQELNADQFKTIVAADAIGNFADQNVAESLQRLPGLSIRRSEGEGQQVAVRGLSGSFVTVTVDGAKLGTRDTANRSVNLDVISSDLLNGIEVTKSLTPDLDADAVAGNVDLKTLSAYDRKGDSFSARAEASYESKAEELNPKVSADLTRLIGENDQFGIAGGVSWSRRAAVVDEFSVDDGLRFLAPTAGGAQVLSPRRFNLRNDPAERTRLSANLNLEFRPNPDNEFFARLSYATFKDDDLRARTRIEFDDATGSRILGVTPTSFSGNRIDIEKRFRFTDQEDKLYSGSVGGENVFGAITADYQIDYSVNESDQPSLEPRFRERDVVASFSDLTKEGANFTLVGDSARRSDPNNPAAYDLRFITQYDVFVEDEVSAARLNLKYDTELLGRPAFFKVGAKIQQRSKSVDEDRADINARAPTTLAAFAPGIPSRTDLNVGFFPSFGLLKDFAREEAAAGLAAGRFSPLLADSSRNDWEADEQVLAGFAMTKFNLLENLQVIAGVRVESTEWETVGNATDLISFDTDITAALATSMTRAITAGTATFTAAQRDAFLANRRNAAGANVEEVLQSSAARREENSYTDVFPSLNLRWDLSDTVMARLSYTTATQRPDFDQAAAISAIRTREVTTQRLASAGQSIPNQITSIAQAQSLVKFERVIEPLRNPKLDPLYANQFDASLAWYPNKDIYLSAAAFYKDLTDFIVPLSFVGAEVTQLGLQPNPTEAISGGFNEVQTFINGDAAEVYGLELAYTQNFTFLPGWYSGLFFSGNVTVSESSANAKEVGREFKLPDQADLIYNVSLGWENKDFSIRWSGNYSGERLVELNGGLLDNGLQNPDSDILEQERFSMDVNLRWNVTDRFQLYADAININDAEDRSFFRARSQGGIFFLRENYGSTYQVGVRAKY